MALASKTCPRCGDPRPVSEFVRLDGQDGARGKSCRTCQPAEAAERGRRPFEFSERVKTEVFLRQRALCAHCRDDFRDGTAAESFHHLIPNQAGSPAHADDAFLRTATNRVMICETCHDLAHDGNTSTGAMTPPAFVRSSHGGDATAHRAWARELSGRVPSRRGVRPASN